MKSICMKTYAIYSKQELVISALIQEIHSVIQMINSTLEQQSQYHLLKVLVIDAPSDTFIGMYYIWQGDEVSITFEIKLKCYKYSFPRGEMKTQGYYPVESVSKQ